MATKSKPKTDPMANAPAHIQQQDQHVPTAESAMPFPTVKLLQALSPELDEEDQKYISDAKMGDIIVTDGSGHKLYPDGLSFCPILVRKMWTEWIPRKQGGGFVASYSSKQEMEVGFTPGNEVVVSIDYLVLSPEYTEGDDHMVPLLLQFNTPTKMGPAREIQKYITQYKTMHGVTYKLGAKKQSNRAGQKFYNYGIAPVGWTDKKLYMLIEAIKQEKEQLFLPETDEAAF